jgi:hypothetical protein
MSEYPPGLGPAVEYLPDHRAVHVDRLAALEALERLACLLDFLVVEVEVDIVSGPASGMRFIVMKAEKEQDPLSIALMKRPPQHPSLVAKAAKAAKPKEPQMANLNEAPIAAPPETPVAKADGDVADLDAGEILVGNPATSATSTPASPGWEQMDADTAQKWTTILTRAKIAVETLSGREAAEAVSPGGEGEDADNSYDLDGASEALDWVIGILAAYAVGEQTEGSAELAPLVLHVRTVLHRPTCCTAYCTGFSDIWLYCMIDHGKGSLPGGPCPECVKAYAVSGPPDGKWNSTTFTAGRKGGQSRASHLSPEQRRGCASTATIECIERPEGGGTPRPPRSSRSTASRPVAS